MQIIHIKSKVIIYLLLISFSLQAVEYFYDDFEGPDQGWTTKLYFGSTDDLWHKTTRASFSSSNSWWFGQELTGNYATGNMLANGLISPAIDLTGASNAYLYFFEKYETENNGDYCRVDVTTNDGTNWSPMRGMGPPQTPSGDSGLWVKGYYNLSNFTGHVIKIRFFFRNNFGNDDYEGWFIDNVRISDYKNLSGTGQAALTPPNGCTNTYGTWRFDYMATHFITNGTYSLTIPADFSAPQNSIPNADGYFTVTNYPLLNLGSPVITGSGPWTITIPFSNLSVSNYIILNYGHTNSGSRGALAPSSFGTYYFPLAVKAGTNTKINVKELPLELVNEAGFGTNWGISPNPVMTNTTQNFYLAFAPDPPSGSLENAYLTVYIPQILPLPQTNFPAMPGYLYDWATPPWVSYDSRTISSNSNCWLVKYNNLTITPWNQLQIYYTNVTVPSYATNLPITMYSAKYGSPPAEVPAGSPFLQVIAGKDGTGTAWITSPVYMSNEAELTLSYTAAFNLTNPEITFDIPAGWSAPQTNNPAGKGYVYEQFSTPVISNLYISGRTIHVEIDGPMDKWQSFNLGYTNVQTPLTPSNYIFPVASRDQGGSLSSITSPPVVRLQGPDSLDVFPTNDIAMASNGTWTLEYTAGKNINNEELIIWHPWDWSEYNLTDPNQDGYTTVSPGTGSPVIGTPSKNHPMFPGELFIPISNMAAGDTIIITFGDTNISTNGSAQIQKSPGTATFNGMQGPNMGWNPIVNICSLEVLLAGTGTADILIGSALLENSTNNSGVLFNYQAFNTMDTGELTIKIPAAFNAPQTNNPTASGYLSLKPDPGVTNAAPVISGSGPWQITIPLTSMPAGRSIAVSYGINFTNNGLPYQGNGIQAAAPGLDEFLFCSCPSNGILMALTNGSPQVSTITNPGFFGSGTALPEPATAYADLSNTWTVTYTADRDLSGATVFYSPPPGWTAMQTNNNSAAGYTAFTASNCIISRVNLRSDINMLEITMAAMNSGDKLIIKYGDTGGGANPGAAVLPPAAGSYKPLTAAGRISNSISSFNKLTPAVYMNIIEDSTPPLVSLTNISGWQKGTVNLSGTVYEDHLGIRSNLITLYTNNSFTAFYRTNSVGGGPSNYTFSFSAVNTASFPDGNNTLHFVTADLSSNTGTNSFSLQVDNSPPAAGITNVQSNEIINNLFTFRGSNSDPHSGIADTVLLLSNQSGWSTNLTAAINSNSWGVTWNMATLAGGEYFITALTVNNSGLSNTSPVVPFYSGITVPDIAETNTAPGAWIGGTHLFSGYSSNQTPAFDPITNLLAVDSAPALNKISSNTLWNSNVDTTGLSNGPHIFYFAAVNSISKTNLIWQTNLVDNQPPLISNVTISAASNSVLSGLNISAGDSGSGLNSYVMAVSNSAEQVTNSWGDFSGKGVPGFKTGTATNLAFMVLDNTANNSSWFYLSDVTNYFIDDTTPPEISFSQTNTWFSSTVTLTNNISEDFSGFSSNTVHVYTNNDLLNCYTNGTISGSIPLFSYHFTVVTTLLTNGTNSLTFIVSNDSTNGAGSVATNTSPLAVDNEKPVINSADYDSMISNGYLTGLSINSSDGFSGVAAYITGLSNGSLTTNSFPVSDPLFIDDFTSAPTNISNLVIYLLDNAGNPSLPYYTGPVTNYKIEDTTPPLVYISNTNQWYADTMLLNGQVEEDLSAVLNSELYIYTNNDLVNTFATLPLSGSLPLYSFSTNINTSLFPDGTNSFHFIVYNETNLMTNITYNILIDNSAPVISALPTNYSLNAATNITLNITDTFSGVSNFSYTLLNSNGSTNSLLYTNITQLLLNNAGTNYIEVTALDRAGNSSSNSFTYYLNPASSALPGLDDLPPPEESLILAQGYSDDELEYLVTNNNNSGGATIITEPDQLVSVVLLAAGKMITLKSAAIVSKHGVRVLSQDINESYNNAKAFFWDKTDNNKQRVRTGIYYIFIVYEADNKEKTASYVVVVSN